VEQLPRYAWFLENSQYRTWPVGQKRPNDLGLFDMHGNVWTWTHNRYLSYPQSNLNDDLEDVEVVTDIKSRIIRGGSFGNLTLLVRSTDRYDIRPGFRNIAIGLRVARTLASD
jgi:formylglycine-generating enzyme required for sulfatase activity